MVNKLNANTAQKLNKNNNNSITADMTLDFNDTISYAQFDVAYYKELKTRLRSALVYSILFTSFFFSPFSLVGLWYGLKAKKEILIEDYVKANKFLTKADYANIIGLVVGSVIYLTLILVLSLFILNFKS